MIIHSVTNFTHKLRLRNFIYTKIMMVKLQPSGGDNLSYRYETTVIREKVRLFEVAR